MMTRRQAIKSTALTAVACSVTAPLLAQTARVVGGADAAPPAGPFTLPPLPYAKDALEPYIDAMTMEIHHGRHHAAYVANLNKAVAGHPELANKSVEDLLRNMSTLPADLQTAIRNQGGGHANHSLFWQMLAKNERQHAKGPLLQVMEKRWVNFEGFKEAFGAAAATVFGSGWAWLTINDKKVIRIETTPNQDTPIMAGRTPLLGLDLWEHAYYLKYQNKRPQYIAAFFNVINWDWVENRYQQLAG